MKERLLGKVVIGNIVQLQKSFEEFSEVNVDLTLQHEEVLEYSHSNLKTIAESVELSSEGTFDKRYIRKIKFSPYDKQGWWIKRTDLEGEPVKISLRNSYPIHEGGVNHIAIRRTGEKNNYFRLTEHIIAIRLGLDIDNLLITVDSDDPPLFEHGSTQIVDALEKVEKIRTKIPCRYFTVRETVSSVWSNGGFLIFAPNDEESLALKIDCAINFSDAIGKQRICFTVDEESLKMGAGARTNCSLKHAIFCKTIGRFLSRTRYLGYNKNNILVAGSKKYFNRARLKYRGKSLEAVWHRAALDLLAAISLIDEGRFVGDVISYKSTHKLDLEFLKELYRKDLIVEITKPLNEPN
ncbi:MAG TPA: hypothetical protein DD381_04460 [Lentisphaeria bacterium]|nr:MAG: hypothetical protein A2X47_07190 [Lentisphaerae bacterium GWF2_38_69]HBM15585.1 hypothetical protein [Lentisphaeria bacterium]